MSNLLTDYLDTKPPPPEKPVPNKFPTMKFPYRLAIIGEAPGADEVNQGEPFVGMSGRMLTGLLSKAGIVREACFIGNVCQIRPPNNDIENFSDTGPEIQAGLAQLNADLKVFQPNICLLLGKTALRMANGETKIGDWRGSLFLGNFFSAFKDRKCLASYHPAACLRNYEWTPLLLFDIKKAFKEAHSPGLSLPQRDLIINPEVNFLVSELESIAIRKPTISVDIEGYVDAMTCISIAESPERSFIVPFAHRNNTNYYENPEDEVKVFTALSLVLADPRIPKILQNGLYDRFVLAYSYGIIVRGNKDDTMLKHWELYCELEKNLGFLCSLYTREPFYKSDRKSDDRDTYWRYCCRDSAVTFEISSTLTNFLDEKAKSHYLFNMSMLNPILYMELRGISYDVQAAATRLVEVNEHIADLQAKLDEVSGYGAKPDATNAELLERAQEIMCYKRDRDQPKKDYYGKYSFWSSRLRQEAKLTLREFAQFNLDCGLSLNTKSKDLKTYFYETLRLPKQWKVDPKTKVERLSTDYEALLKLSKLSDHPAVQTALEIGLLRTRAQMLQIGADYDQRIRCGYNVVGTETGRLTCYTSPTGSGYNLQTIPKENHLKPLGHPLRRGMRDLFRADPGYYLFECDLSGADGWTVAAHLASCGDPTMLDDYRFGLKPAKILCYMLFHGAGSIQGKSRQEIKDLTASISKDSWEYFACKIGQHMTSYHGGPRKLASVILMESEGKFSMTEGEVRQMQDLFHIRYRVRLWWDKCERAIRSQPFPPRLTCCSGHTRRFFNRKDEIIGQWLAHEPQNNTTYATNRAALNLWTDPDNRIRKCDGSCEGRVAFPICECEGIPHLRVEPLHQVHDALLGQFLIEDTAWAIGKIKQWFNNTLVIAGIPLVIPFEGAYGTNWALDDNSKVGDIK